MLELEGTFDLTQSDSAPLIREETEARRREGTSPGEPTLVSGAALSSLEVDTALGLVSMKWFNSGD